MATKGLSRPAPKAVGRPSSYQVVFEAQAYRLALLGATDVEIADFFGTSIQTLNTWKKVHPKFLESLKAGKMKSDSEVADKLFQKATGFEWDEVQPIKLKEVIYENGKRLRETERVEQVVVRKVVPPDTTAIIFWLKNRRRDEWRDKQEIEQPALPPANNTMNVFIGADAAKEFAEWFQQKTKREIVG